MSKKNILRLDLLMNMPEKLREASLFINTTVKEAGFDLYLVGGSVRDLLLKKQIADLDFTTNALPQDISSLFKHTVPVGIQFGTILVIYKGVAVEITTYREEQDYKDGRRPEKVTYGTNLETDVIRRDFTINGMAYDITQGILIDYTNGLQDLKKQIIRTIGKANERFGEDALRLVRACRFAAQLNFTLESQVKKALSQSSYMANKIVAERFLAEWIKTTTYDRKDIFWKLLYKSGIMSILLKDFTFYHDHKIFSSYIKLLYLADINQFSIYFAYMLYCEYITVSLSPSDFCQKYATVGKTLKIANREINQSVEYLFSPLFKLDNDYNHKSQDKGSIFRRQNLCKTKKNKISKNMFKKILCNILPEYLNNHIHYFCSIVAFKEVQKYRLSSLSLFQKNYISTKKSLDNLLESIQNEPIYLQELEINGHHLKQIGFQGKELGMVIDKLHRLVIRYPQFNQKEILQRFAQKSYHS